MSLNKWLLQQASEISDGAFKILFILCEHSRQEDGRFICWPGNSRLAELAGCSERTVQARLVELKEAGKVSTEPRARGGRLFVIHATAPARSRAEGVRDDVKRGERSRTHNRDEHPKNPLPPAKEGATAIGQALPVVVVDSSLSSLSEAAAGLPAAQRRGITPQELAKAASKGIAAGFTPERSIAAVIGALDSPNIRSPLSAAAFFVPSRETMQAIKRLSGRTFTASKPTYPLELATGTVDLAEVERIKAKMFRRLGVKQGGTQ